MNKGSGVVGICALCQNSGPLCDSHLIPAAAFRLLRDSSLDNPNPVIIGESAAYTSSKQVSDYLLCPSCESRFRSSGEDWVLANCCRDSQTFAIQQALQNATPALTYGETVIYEASRVAGIEPEKLIYFGLSVFWRAGCHSWPWQGGSLSIELGPYLEPLRKFLYEDAPFPDNMALVVHVQQLENFISRVMLPQSRRENGYHVHTFTIPGLLFFISVGQRLPPTASAIRKSRCFIVLNPTTELDAVLKMSAGAKAVRPPRGYKGL